MTEMQQLFYSVLQYHQPDPDNYLIKPYAITKVYPLPQTSFLLRGFISCLDTFNQK